MTEPTDQPERVRFTITLEAVQHADPLAALAEPSMLLVTIHDAILTTAAHIPAVESAIIAEFGRLGTMPKIRPNLYWT